MADILIRGMEMPRDCRECPLNVSIYTYDGGDETCALNAWDGYSEQPKITQHPDCPLVPLPEGHGRLGDLDALMKNIGDVPYKGAVRRVLMSAPTIVPAEGGGEE